MDARGVHLKIDAMESGLVLAETRELVAASRSSVCFRLSACSCMSCFRLSEIEGRAVRKLLLGG